MTDRWTLVLSWMLIVVLVPISFWDRDAGVLVAGIAAVMRWDDIRTAEKAMNTAKDKGWILYGFYLVALSVGYLILKLSDTLPAQETSSGYIVLVAILVPLVPKFLRHEYNRYLESGSEH